jgi:hypothetical protein
MYYIYRTTHFLVDCLSRRTIRTSVHHISYVYVTCCLLWYLRRRILAYPLSVLLPKGCIIRTTQIVGSFIILNGTIAAVQKGQKTLATKLGGGVGIDTQELIVEPRAELMRRVKIERTQASQDGQQQQDK